MALPARSSRSLHRPGSAVQGAARQGRAEADSPRHRSAQ
jgi:hypothetical protein